MRCDLMRLTSYGIYLVLFVHVALIHILSQSYKSQHESTLWTAWHAAPPCHDFFVAQWTRRHLHAMAPGTLQTILYLMINGSAIRVWGMWYDGFFFSEPSPILAPKSNASKKWKEQPQLCCWGTFCPHPVPRSVPSRWSSAALESARCCGRCFHECRIPWPPKQSECLKLSQINIGMLRL